MFLPLSASNRDHFDERAKKLRRSRRQGNIDKRGPEFVLQYFAHRVSRKLIDHDNLFRNFIVREIAMSAILAAPRVGIAVLATIGQPRSTKLATFTERQARGNKNLAELPAKMS